MNNIESYPFIVGSRYSRKDVYRIIGIPEDTKGGNWDTGYSRHLQDWFIFCSVGIPGKTGHDYPNRFVGDQLVWFGKTDTRLDQPAIQSLLHPLGHVYVFARETPGPFVFLGFGFPVESLNTTPVQITWRFEHETYIETFEKIPEELTTDKKFREGRLKKVQANVYERNPLARAKCIEHYGCYCQICGFDFEKVYGELGKGFIHVHHIERLSDVKEEYYVDPINDLIPLCANCHAMVHRGVDTNIELIRELISKRKSLSQ